MKKLQIFDWKYNYEGWIRTNGFALSLSKATQIDAILRAIATEITALHRKVVALDKVKDPEELAKYPGLQFDNRYESLAGVIQYHLWGTRIAVRGPSLYTLI